MCGSANDGGDEPPPPLFRPTLGGLRMRPFRFTVCVGSRHGFRRFPRTATTSPACARGDRTVRSRCPAS
jgi:hypothetical protein